jgi:predicted Zn-dependent peptidase
MLEIQRGEVAGVPLFWTGETPAPRTAGLVFRVGFADEALPDHGITHLVEHLALFTLGRGLAEYNGVVGPHLTTFFAQGEPDELAAFLRDVSTALHALPHDRLDAEKRVLLAESAGRQSTFPDRMAWMRWGETGPGLADVLEFGLRRLGAKELDRWVADRFTAGNAAVWLDGPPPEGLELPLPPGERRPVAVAAPEPGPAFPAYRRDGRGGLGITLVGGGTGFSVAGIVARQRLFDELRRDRGLVYDVDAAFELLGHELGVAMLSAACEDPDAGPVRDALLATLHDLAEHGPTTEELEHEVEQTRRDLSDPRALEAAAAACAERELHGRSFRTAAESLERTRAVTPEVAARELAAALETALLVVPETLDGDPPDGFEAWSVPSPEPARPEGRSFREKETSSCRHGRCEIVIGEGRLHWVAGDGEGETTVPLDRLLALMWSAGDTLSLMTPFGGGFHFCPSGYDREELLAELAKQLPGGLEDRTIPAAEHPAAIDRAAREQLPHVEAVGDELEALADLLDRGEEPVLLAQAAGEGHPGLLAVTARRLVYFEPHEGRDSAGTKHELLLTAAEEVEAGADEDGGRLRVRVRGEDVVIGAIQPPERAAHAAELVDRARAEGGTVAVAE